MKALLTLLIGTLIGTLIGCDGSSTTSTGIAGSSGIAGSGGSAGMGGAGGVGGTGCVPDVTLCSADATCDIGRPMVCHSPVDLRPGCYLDHDLCDGDNRLFCCP